MPVDVGRGVGFGEAERLRLGHRFLERSALGKSAQQEVARAVHHAFDRDDPAVAAQPRDRLEDRRTAADGGGIGKAHPARLGTGVERIVMRGERGLVGGDDMGPALQRRAHDLRRIVGPADRLDQEVRLDGERVGERIGIGLVAHRLMRARPSHQHRADLEQVRPLLEVGEDAGADRAAAEERDPQLRKGERHLAPRRQGGDHRRLVMADGGDLDRDARRLRRVDRLGLDQPGARLMGAFVGQRPVALGVGMDRRILRVDAVDILQQPHPLRAEPRGEEHGRKIGSAAAERHHPMFGMTGGEARHHHHVMVRELRIDRTGIERDQIGVERRAGRDQPHLVRIEHPGPDPHPAEREAHQRRRPKLPDPGQPGDEAGRRIAADPGRLGEQRVGLAGERGDDRDDLLAVADVTIDFLRAGPVIVLAFEHRAAELEHDEPPRAVLSIQIVHRLVAFVLGGGRRVRALKNPLAGFGERVGGSLAFRAL